ncbi:hypothetical protein SAMN05216552_10845 [Pseudoduganella namucuonensis]|uniref:Uncharacterized protein n=1 Tax=Pseudoduganella namucuonensis TaxID=1035707 RepID=A0A1I7M7X3_9BURK|nr:hypothetical protein SAMN05216552_10845 [Pseudoduganella namucuonensis]
MYARAAQQGRHLRVRAYTYGARKQQPWHDIDIDTSDEPGPCKLKPNLFAAQEREAKMSKLVDAPQLQEKHVDFAEFATEIDQAARRTAAGVLSDGSACRLHRARRLDDRREHRAQAVAGPGGMEHRDQGRDVNQFEAGQAPPERRESAPDIKYDRAYRGQKRSKRLRKINVGTASTTPNTWTCTTRLISFATSTPIKTTSMAARGDWTTSIGACISSPKASRANRCRRRGSGATAVSPSRASVPSISSPVGCKSGAGAVLVLPDPCHAAPELNGCRLLSAALLLPEGLKWTPPSSAVSVQRAPSGICKRIAVMMTPHRWDAACYW